MLRIIQKLLTVKVILGILAVVAISGFFLWPGKSINIKGVAAPLNASLFLDRDKDTDADGLKDWEEAIYGTDINNPDTDGDSYNDKEEIVSGYDPLKKRPDDKLGYVSNDSGSSSGIDPSNLSEVFTKSVLDVITSGKTPTLAEIEAGQIPSFDFTNDPFFKSSLENLSKSLSLTVPEEEIKTIKTSRQTAEKYARQVTAILDDPNVESPEIITAVFKNKDFQGLDQVIQTYKDIYEKFKNVAVPDELKEFHKDSLAVLYKTQQLLSYFRQIDQDPLKAAMAWKLYVEMQTNDIPVLAFKTAKTLEKYYKQ